MNPEENKSAGGLAFIKNIDWKEPKNILKAVGIVLVAVIVLSFVSRLLMPSFNLALRQSGISTLPSMGMPMGYGGVYGGEGYAVDMVEGEAAMLYSKDSGMAYAPNLSVRNIRPVPQGTTGDDAEEYEVTDYSATIETSHLKKTCDQIITLKAHTYVIFENSNMYDRGCSFTFKVANDNVSSVLAIIKDLDPKDLNENTHTIKQVVDDFTAEEVVLKKKLESIEKTLESALKAYDEITSLATRTGDAESLAKIINSKIQIIERLSQERIRVNEQLDRLSRAKANQLDRVDYTYFQVSVIEDKYIDKEHIKDAWKNALRQFVFDVNKVLQDVTINLIGFLLFALQWILYFFILLIIVKYGWHFTKQIWNK
jgi:hypothetical protein